ncbi:sensor histidine kinase [Inhella proteolytica]|uniref:Histidine kinase n=1 Tax=Inhella proteolytica TaxID=2795029 RepID=A0A931J014_9BURK|nr:histidine kinase [Inhella proteolytica]MBH9576203.1 histidine kinase [Inhella proteolytica]
MSPGTSPLRLVGANALLWAAAAGGLSIAAPGVDTLPRLLVFSECVGAVMLAVALLMRRLPRLTRLRPAQTWALTAALAIPLGYIGGHALALLFLGEPFRLTGTGAARLAPVVVHLLVGGIGLHYLAAREQLAQEARARAEAQRLATETELRLLRAQLEPHMLFNTLANLRALLREDAGQAEHMIDQLIAYLRATLAASRHEASTLEAEFAQLRAYLEIMALRMGPRLSYTLELPPELAATPLPAMLLQPLVENAIKHGLEPKVGPGRLTVQAHLDGAHIEITVRDDGLGLGADGQFQRPLDGPASSYGLQHVRERLRAAYGPPATLTLSPLQPQGLCSRVRIPS